MRYEATKRCLKRKKNDVMDCNTMKFCELLFLFNLKEYI